MATSIAVANAFLMLSKNNGVLLNQMQLQKLVYIAHGWNLAIYNSPLTEDEIIATDYGPIYPKLQKALTRYGADPVLSFIKNQ